MEDFLVLLLFIYPGVASEWLLLKLTANKSYFPKCVGMQEMLRYLALSAVIMIPSIYLTSKFMNLNVRELSDIITTIKSLDGLTWYFTASLVSIFVISVLLSLILEKLYFLINLWNRYKKRPLLDEYNSQWTRLFLKDSCGLNSEEVILVVKKEGEELSIGKLESFPDDINAIKEFVLKPYEYSPNINQLVYTYIGLDEGWVIEFYDDTKSATP